MRNQADGYDYYVHLFRGAKTNDSIKEIKVTEIIKIQTNENHEPVVNARELHEYLGIGTEFRHWFPRMAEYGFEKGVDYTPVIFEHPQNKQQYTDYHITIDMAKELCMIQRNEKGRQARQYFIAVEKEHNSPEKIMARALMIADQTISNLRIENLEMKPKALFADAVASSKTTILIGELAKLIKQNGIDIGANRLFEWMRTNGYLIKRKGTDYNMPTQRAMDLELFQIKESTHIKPDGSSHTTKTTKVTGKGQQYFINKFLQEGAV